MVGFLRVIIVSYRAQFIAIRRDILILCGSGEQHASIYRIEGSHTEVSTSTLTWALLVVCSGADVSAMVK